MNVLPLIASSSYITLNKNLIRIFGIEAAAIVGMFASIANYNDNDWFYATYERIEEELGLGKHVAAKAIEKIYDAGILIDKREGIPCRRHFRFQEVELMNFLSLKNQTTSRSEITQQAGRILPTQVVQKSNDINKNKDNNKLSLSLEEMEEYWKLLKKREKYQFEIDVKKFYDWCFDEEDKLKIGWKNIMKSWAEKPRNQIKISNLVSEPKEISVLRRKIKREFLSSNPLNYDLYFAGCDIDLENSIIFVKTRKALQYQDILDKIKIKIKFRQNEQ